MREADTRQLRGAVAMLLLAIACSPASPSPPTDRAAVHRFLWCEECVHGEMEAVLDPMRHDRVVPLLSRALRGLSASQRANVRRQLDETYQVIASRALVQHTIVPLTQVDYVAHLLSNHEATYQARAVSALAAIGTPAARAALEAAAEGVRSGALLARGDVVEELSAAIGEPIVKGVVGWIFISAGPMRTCGIRSDGRSYCWGRNNQGQLGDGTATNRPAPTPIAGGLRFTSISTGAGDGTHTCGIADSLYCWGSNGAGQLGDGSTTPRPTPGSVAAGVTFVGVAVGDVHTCAWTAGHQVYCWGKNNVGQLGDGGTTDRHQPGPTANGLQIRSMQAGAMFTCADSLDGHLYCWGANDSGELGDGTTNARPLPAPVKKARRLSSFAIGESHTCGLTKGGAAFTEGLAFCTGLNISGQRGDGTTTTSDTLIAVAGRYRFQMISGGFDHTCGIVSGTRQLRCWGGNSAGQLGDGTTTDRPLPVTVADSLSFATVSTGAAHTCGITTQGVAYCWGRNVEGQLGDGTTANRPTPVQVITP